MAYDRSAAHYDQVYAEKPYAAEAAALRAHIAARCPGARTLLDVGCGTGGHLAHLRDHFAVEGVELAPDMIAVARAKLPGIPIHEGDMRDLSLGRTFDAVTCLFSTIGYVRSAAELATAIDTMAVHVAPGGVLAVEPWFTPAQWQPESKAFGSLFVDRDDLKVARFGISQVRGRLAILPMHHVIVTPTSIDHFDEVHELFLAEPAELEAAFTAAGLTAVEYVADALVRGLWLGTRPSSP